MKYFRLWADETPGEGSRRKRDEIAVKNTAVSYGTVSRSRDILPATMQVGSGETGSVLERGWQRRVPAPRY